MDELAQTNDHEPTRAESGEESTGPPLGTESSSSEPEEVRFPPSPEPPAVSGEPPSPPEPEPFPSSGQLPPFHQYAAPIKDRSLGLILEILPGLFGIFGIGWIYTGETNTGVLILIGGLAMMGIFVVADVLSAGICCFGTIPLQLLALAISTVKLNDLMKQHPERFR
jgi:hypothetical protein